MQFGINNTVIPPAPSVNLADFNTIALVGLAPKGAKNTLITCASDTDDSQFGSCLTGFTIPWALSIIRQEGAGKVVVINVYDEATHAVQVTDENTTVLSQKAKLAANPVNTVVLKNTPVSPVSATAATAALAITVAPTNGDTLTDIIVDGVSLFATPLVFDGTSSASITAAKTAVVAKINAHTGTSGFSATAGSTGAFTITAPTVLGATINGEVSEPTILAGTIEFGTNNAFAGGVTEVVEVVSATYTEGTDYTIDEYGNVKVLISVADSTVWRATYKKLDPSLVLASHIIGTVSGATRTGCKLLDKVRSVLGIVPKLFIIPTYNTAATVQTEMERLSAKLRMQPFYTSTTSMTLAQAISSRGPSGPLATFNIASKKAIAAFPKVYNYDPQSATLVLNDPSASLAGFMSYNAAVNGPHVSTSNQVMKSVGGTEITLVHEWEDANSAGETNQLRNQGIVSIFSEGGYRWWGAENTSFPSNTAVDLNICVVYVNHVITDSLTDFAKQYIDKNITNGSIDAFVTAANEYYSSLMVRGWIGKSSKVSFKKERNPDADLKAGKIRFTRNTFYFVGMKLIELEENMEVELPTV